MSDMVFIHLALYFPSSLNILLDCIKNLDHPSANRENQRLIRYLQIYHLEIIKNLQLFNRTLNYVLTAQFSTIFFWFIVMFYMIGIFKDMLFIYPVLTAVFFQLSTFCFFGELIIGKTESISTELYLTNWYEYSREEKMIVSMMMMMSQKSFVFKAAGMYDHGHRENDRALSQKLPLSDKVLE
ncbi:odorant receptor 82a [Phlebotomus papatasi]|uniref:odorant receptor 82a n=1 Tax=Phlebotomus papatasi TaxID=29031 RepID=UPI0024837D64|nr:odorant receptor 82a [Phlebotomus papatasi]